MVLSIYILDVVSYLSSFYLVLFIKLKYENYLTSTTFSRFSNNIFEVV